MTRFETSAARGGKGNVGGRSGSGPWDRASGGVPTNAGETGGSLYCHSEGKHPRSPAALPLLHGGSPRAVAIAAGGDSGSTCADDSPAAVPRNTESRAAPIQSFPRRIWGMVSPYLQASIAKPSLGRKQLGSMKPQRRPGEVSLQRVVRAVPRGWSFHTQRLLRGQMRTSVTFCLSRKARAGKISEAEKGVWFSVTCQDSRRPM